MVCLNTNLFWCHFFFFFRCYVSLSFGFFGGLFFTEFLMPHEYFGHIRWWFLWKLCDRQTLFHYFSSLFFIRFFVLGSQHIDSPLFPLSVGAKWKNLCMIVFLLSQNLDTSPEARTVWSKFPILFEVFWLFLVHKWTKGRLTMADFPVLTLNRMDFWIFSPKWREKFKL